MKYLDQKLQEILEQNKIAGMAVAITDREKVIYSKGFGLDSVERPHIPADPSSIYRVASITKVVTGSVIMRLVEDGVLDLDTPIKNYVSWLDFTSKEALETMTLRHLLSHTAGLPVEYTPDGPREESALEETLKAGLGELEFCSLPGDGVFLYSNWGIRLASYIAQVKTGKYFTELAQEYVLDPLGMTQTTFDLRNAATYPISVPHIDTEDGKLVVFHRIKENAARMAAGGMYSNAPDLCKLARYLLSEGKNDAGETVLRTESVREMCAAHSDFDKEHGDFYGLTMILRKYEDGFLYGHLGSAPPYTLAMLTDPKSGYGVVVLMNTERDDIRFSVSEMIFDYLRGMEK